MWSRNIKNGCSIYIYIYIYDISRLRVNRTEPKRRNTHECWHHRQIDICTVHVDGIALSLFSYNEAKAEHSKARCSLHCVVMCMHSRDVCKYCGRGFEWQLDASLHSVYLHQCIFISFFESYFSFHIVATVLLYLDSNEQGGNHSMGEGQELQPVTSKIMKYNFSCILWGMLL